MPGIRLFKLYSLSTKILKELHEITNLLPQDDHRIMEEQKVIDLFKMNNLGRGTRHAP
jgi:hypothetical protein